MIFEAPSNPNNSVTSETAKEMVSEINASVTTILVKIIRAELQLHTCTKSVITQNIHSKMYGPKKVLSDHQL